MLNMIEAEERLKQTEARLEIDQRIQPRILSNLSLVCDRAEPSDHRTYIPPPIKILLASP
jgi:hypothetical protein